MGSTSLVGPLPSVAQSNIYNYQVTEFDSAVISNLLQIRNEALAERSIVHSHHEYTIKFTSNLTHSSGRNIVHLFNDHFIRILCVSAFHDSQPQQCMASRNPNHLRPYLIYGELFDFILGVESNGIKEWVVLR